MTDSTTESGIFTTVNLVRSSHPWTEVDSAAGFVLRYLIPMRRQLIDILGSPTHADRSLKILLGHLVSSGFGEHKQGRLRDYLLRAVRSAAKATAAELPEAERPELKLDDVRIDSRRWLAYWREGLLQRAWRSLERFEHANDDAPVYAILSAATADPKLTAEMLAVAVQNSSDTAPNDAAPIDAAPIDAVAVTRLLPVAKTMFAQFIADEVAETLQTPDREAVSREITALGLGKAFEGVQY